MSDPTAKAINEPAGANGSSPDWISVSRASAGFLGCFALLNLLGEWFHPGFDANILWIDLRPMSQQFVRGLLGLAAAALMLFAVHPNLTTIPRRIVQFTVILLLATSVANSIQFLRLLESEQIHSSFPIPFSAQVALVLLVILAGTLPASPGPRHDGLVILTVFICGVGFPLTQFYCFGKTDYRIEADAVVVFGCRVYADGTPSWALKGRLDTACQLVREGLADYLIVSGGPGDGDIHETETMREMAIEQGVDPDRILVDPDGWNTWSTVQNTSELIRTRGWSRILAVSDFYHLPRIKLAFRRTGVTVRTVPVEAEPRNLPSQIAREILAWWYYYLQPRQTSGHA